MIGQPLPDVFRAARCATHPDPDLWFRCDQVSRARAKSECRLCPALEACRELGRRETWGVWGGQIAGGPANRDGSLDRMLRAEGKYEPDRYESVTFTAHDARNEQAS